MSDSRGDVDLVGHNVVFVPNPDVGPTVPVNNIIIKAHRPEDLWKEEAMRRIGDWRAKLRSTYIRWALAINGLDVAAKKYDDPAWAARNKFTVTSLRQERNIAAFVPIAEWDGKTAAEAHRKTMPMLAAFGVIDLYANLEEVVFSLYRIYLSHNPEPLIRGDDNRELRQLRRAAQEDPAKEPAWQEAWSTRLNAWQRKKLYDGLGKVFRAFCAESGLKAPSAFTLTTTDTWAESIDTVALVRHSLVHGVDKVSADLAAACKKPYSMAFKFEEGKPLVVNLLHLQGVDLFCEQLLDGINLSLVELMPDAPKPEKASG